MNVSKDWLESVCGLLEQFYSTYEAMVKCDELNRKIVNSQKTITDLQAQVIYKSNQEVACTKNTVKEQIN